MADDEVRLTSSTGAEKGAKLARHSLIPSGPLTELAEHYGRGAKKYADRNWEAGYDWHLSYDALTRHLTQFWGGENIDAETGSKHIIAVAWHALALAEFMETHPEFDDRPKVTPVADVDGPWDSFEDVPNDVIVRDKMGSDYRRRAGIVERNFLADGWAPSMDWTYYGPGRFDHYHAPYTKVD